MNLQVDVQEKDCVHVFRIVGEIDAFTAPTLKERLDQVADQPQCQAVLDFSEVDYMDSTGLGVFVAFYKRVKAVDGSVKIVGLNKRLKRLFEITGLDDIVEIEMESRDVNGTV
ncbi:anti-sigma factor antagonist [Sporosarcina sp. NCCP-2716]|uniref:STAS domain-containing protein n=1 Tax=Sporosarcina sp. NCCP-2716 TaxID=2943679 RepID=UPI00203E41C2|nr:STAS domain-containing protein [Sporosarcina sp. NCCP-2716]GKV68257.1 anti-sigma factor antagonist [Sporosarcina sp. NCCP-2716]